MSVLESNTLRVAGFTLGLLGCILTFLTLMDQPWRLLRVHNSTKYMPGITQLGLWKICLPPTLKGADNYSLICCHKFRFYERFFPVEMRLGQILMIVAFFFALMGLFCLLPLNVFYPLFMSRSRWKFIAGGFLNIIASICIFFSVGWNTYTVTRNKTLSFPSSFHLPSALITQKIGPAIYTGYIAGILLFISGICIIVNKTYKPDIIMPS